MVDNKADIEAKTKSMDEKQADADAAMTGEELYVARERSMAEDAEAQERADAMRIRLGVVEQHPDPFVAIKEFENLESKNPDVALSEGDEAEGLDEAASDRADEAEDTAKDRILPAVQENFQNAPEGPDVDNLKAPKASKKSK